MKKLILKRIEDYNVYVFSDGEKEYNMNIIFEEYKPVEGDTVYFPESIIEEINIYTFGPYNNESSVGEVIKIIHDEKEVYMSRYYG